MHANLLLPSSEPNNRPLLQSLLDLFIMNVAVIITAAPFNSCHLIYDFNMSL